MVDLNRDPIINVIHNGIKRGIRVALENNCLPAALILIYSGIDTMAYLNMPADQDDVQREDFVEWAEKYVHFPCQQQVTGLELYGARCGLLHSHSTASRLSRENKVRQIGYVDKGIPEVQFNPSVSKELVMVSVTALADAFFRGVDKFLIDVFSDKQKAHSADERFKVLVHTLAYDKGPV